MGDVRERGVYSPGALCDECGKPSPRVRVCGECELAERIHRDRDKREADLTAERDQLKARVQELEGILADLDNEASVSANERDQARMRIIELERERDAAHERARADERAARDVETKRKQAWLAGMVAAFTGAQFAFADVAKRAKRAATAICFEGASDMMKEACANISAKFAAADAPELTLEALAGLLDEAKS